MYFDKIQQFQTGVALEITSADLRALIADAMAGNSILELEQIRRPEDLHAYLSVKVHEGAEGLIKRRRPWAGKIKADLAAGKPVTYGSFSNLFWRNLDEQDPDGDEWYRLVANERFDAELTGLLNKVRAAQRILRQSTDSLARMNWASFSSSAFPADVPAF
ncbi:hypothetical protein SCT_0484 [Sulfuricella sp. T08]|uniref:hypothetical protein n=1 Tax=Sulfuricella sp. T08 TaxID=1632857 RepID=UPI000617993D|nr:hypothetical protein [Sulfuricella sp. T08]GAO35103.1 hypothetical protein SCT_0484 [Sulfuricella sp. T08]